MSADALVVDQVAAAAAARKKAKSLFEAAAGEDPFRQTSVFCRSVDADGDRFAELHESEDEQHGKYLKLLSSPNAASNLGALPSAPPTTMFDAASEPEEEPTLPKPLPSNTKFAFVTVIFGDGSRFALDAAVMGNGLTDPALAPHFTEVIRACHTVLVSRSRRSSYREFVA